MKKPTPPTSSCPCGSGRMLPECCGRYHAGEPAPDAETLMRSRYSAYVLGNEAYLLSTWHETTRPARIELDTGGKPRWLGLDVRRHESTGAETATVEFVARYKIGGRAHRMHETSRFRLENGRWYHADADFNDARTTR